MNKFTIPGGLVNVSFRGNSLASDGGCFAIGSPLANTGGPFASSAGGFAGGTSPATGLAGGFFKASGGFLNSSTIPAFVIPSTVSLPIKE